MFLFWSLAHILEHNNHYFDLQNFKSILLFPVPFHKNKELFSSLNIFMLDIKQKYFFLY